MVLDNNVKNHQLVQLRTQRGTSSDRGSSVRREQIETDSNQLFARINREEINPLYDFVAVTKRMDESLIVLKMLWGLETGDIIVSSAKAGQYSYNWELKGTCFHIPRTVKSEGVMEHIRTDFRKANGDFLLHAISNRSLDLTIDSLGCENFDRSKYTKLRKLATSQCMTNTTFPCSLTGEWQPEYKGDCDEFDVGCGYRCIDNILDQYESGKLALEQREREREPRALSSLFIFPDPILFITLYYY